MKKTLLYSIPAIISLFCASPIQAAYNRNNAESDKASATSKNLNDGAGNSIDQKLKDLIDNANGPTVIKIPAGTHTFKNTVRVKTSNIHLEFDPGAVLKTDVDPMITVGPSLTPRVSNFSITTPSASSKFEVNFENRSDNQSTKFVSLSNVEKFYVGSYNVRDNYTSKGSVSCGNPPADDDATIRPTNGTIEKINGYKMHGGYGVCQIHAAANIVIKKLHGRGGVTLRLEHGAGAGDATIPLRPGVTGGTVSAIKNTDGGYAVLMSPHSRKSEDVTVKGTIKANGSSFAMKLSKGFDDTNANLPAGKFVNTKITANVSSVYKSNTAQHEQPTRSAERIVPDSEWQKLYPGYKDYVNRGPSVATIYTTSTDIQIPDPSKVTSEGYPSASPAGNKPILEKSDRVSRPISQVRIAGLIPKPANVPGKNADIN